MGDQFGCFGPCCEDSKADICFTGDLVKSCSMTSETTMFSNIQHRDSIFDELFDEIEYKPVQTYQTMIIGCRGVGKYTLISSLFKDKRCSCPFKQAFNFISKSIHLEKLTKSFKLWLEEPDIEDQRYDILRDIYYKTTKTFLFIYDTSKPDSLRALGNTITNIYKSNPENQVFTALLGNVRKDSKKLVNLDEARAFQEEHGIHFLKEIDFLNDEYTEILELVECNQGRQTI